MCVSVMLILTLASFKSTAANQFVPQITSYQWPMVSTDGHIHSRGTGILQQKIQRREYDICNQILCRYYKFSMLLININPP